MAGRPTADEAMMAALREHLGQADPEPVRVSVPVEALDFDPGWNWAEAGAEMTDARGTKIRAIYDRATASVIVRIGDARPTAYSVPLIGLVEAVLAHDKTERLVFGRQKVLKRLEREAL